MPRSPVARVHLGEFLPSLPSGLAASVRSCLSQSLGDVWPVSFSSFSPHPSAQGHSVGSRHLAAGRGGCAPAPARPGTPPPAPQTAGLTRLRAHPVPRPSSSHARSPGLEGPRDARPRGSRWRVAASRPRMGVPPAGHWATPVSAVVPASGPLGAASPTPLCPQATSPCVRCPDTCVVLARDARAPRLWMSCLLVLLDRVGVVRTSSSFPGRTTV